MSLRKIFSIAIFLVGLTLVANIFYPQIGDNIKKLLAKLPIKLQQNNVSGNKTNNTEAILGEQISNELDEQGIISELKKVPSQIYQQEIVREATQRINQIIADKVEEAKKVPEQQLEEMKKDLRKQIYQGICQDWLKENGN